MFDLEKISKHTSKQEGLVTREQALREGLSGSSIDRAVQRELLIPVFRGVYRVVDTPVTPKLLRRAALLWAGEGAVLSHVTAGVMWKLEGLDDDAEKLIWVSVPAGWHLYPPPGVRVIRAQGLRKGRRHILVEGLPCTSLARTLFDLSRYLTGEAFEIAFDSAERANPDTRQRLRALVQRLHLRGRQGAGAVREVLRAQDLSATGSPLEVRVRRVFRAARIPPPIPQLQITDEKTGDEIAVVDFAWPERRLIVEVDGKKFHDTEAAFHRDPARRSRLTANGWHVIVVTSKRLKTDRNGFIQDVRRRLGLDP